MAIRIGAGTIRLEKPVAIAATAAVGSRMEKEGPLGAEFDRLVEDSSFGEKSWEKAETKMQTLAIELALQKGNTTAEQVDVMLGGDLLNQCIASAYAVREQGRPFLGLYGACSTMAESLTLASLLVESGAARKALAVTSSHFCSSERQFRFPLDYGGVRTPTAQHTATAAGAALVGMAGPITVREVCIGRVVDLGVTDMNNMGAAMAPAAWDTLRQYFTDTGTSPGDYDKIITGDLAQVGSDLLVRLAAEENCDLRPRYTDCGLMLYEREKQQVDAGASGCGCSAAVMCAHFLPAMQQGKYRNILFMATGALMSPTACQQGESIPGIAHLLHLTAKGGTN
ncbi:MAG: stage V sporulation protein AD [Angelakisella sp.]|nr:stage V sporulation protein AD [Angelakisella sp.]